MSLKIIGIGGEPATGKTTLMRELIRRICKGRKQLKKKLKTCKFTVYPESQVIVLGVYDNKPFGGTDRLSMAVQPDAKNLILNLIDNPEYDNYTILFEGDRLFNLSFINWLKSQNILTFLYILKVGDSILNNRHLERKDKQSSSWLIGRKTKVNKITQSVHDIILLPNDTYNQQLENISNLLNNIHC